MNLIDQFGGYEKAKRALEREIRLTSPNTFYCLKLDEALLQHRRQHNIFEVGDKVVSKENNEFVYTVITVDGGLGRLKNILFDHVYQLHNFRHATDAEIEAGKRLEVDCE